MSTNRKWEYLPASFASAVDLGLFAIFTKTKRDDRDLPPAEEILFAQRVVGWMVWQERQPERDSYMAFSSGPLVTDEYGDLQDLDTDSHPQFWGLCEFRNLPDGVETFISSFPRTEPAP